MMPPQTLNAKAMLEIHDQGAEGEKVGVLHDSATATW
jgi:hypothetical protein